MSRPRFTPGPWQIGRSGREQPYQIEDLEGRCVTKWGGISRPASAEGEANARLIASAPDLLQALLIATSKPLAEHCTDEEWAVIRNALMTAQGEA